ncbi:MAG: amino acid adenylation domain-containing protein, partial [Acidobacteriota bacterium]|nr:amino acid adenylation domain-containing protein [Acidobacteriota bacterium]
LSVAALERAVAQLVRRHDSLRTVFVSAEGKARQAVLPSMAVPLPVVDLSRLPGSTAAELSRRWMARLVRRSFSLRKGPLLRLLLMRLGERRWQLAVDMHHIVSDVWSIGVLTQELGALYSAQRRGETAELPPLPLQYGDFARWQRQWLEGERLERLLGYWRQRLAGAPPVLELPTDRPRPAEPTGRGALVGFHLDAELYRGVRRLGRGAGATPFMVLLAVFLVLLRRYSGQSDLCVGMPIANRTRSEVEGLIGFFVNTLVLRGDVSGSPSFQELLGRVAATTVEAYDYQDLPFEKLVEELQPQRDLSHHPLFQVLFQLQTTAAQELQLEGLELRREIIDSGQAMFDLLFYLEEAAEGAIAATVQYALDLFDTSTVERMGRHYRTLVASAVADPESPVTRLQLLPAAERHQMLVVWNRGGGEKASTTVEEGAAARLDELFFQQARRTPEAIALIHYWGGDPGAGAAERWTYGELAARVVAWARHLEGLGVGPETSVAVCLPRQPELVTALLAVLAAGGTYVPVDPAYPRERVEVMLEDSGARWVLGTAETLQRLPESRARGLAMDGDAPAPEEDWAEVTSSRAPGAKEPARASALAYMIFTSGSTGRPKAVAIEHRSAVHMVRWALERFSPAERAVMLAATSVCFDLSVFELFAGLCGGSRVVLVQSALELAEVPEEEGVSLINTVPSAMTELVRLEALPPSVKVVNLAGEPLQRVLVDSVRRSRPGVRVFNLYGPSEDTTYSTEEEVPANTSAPAIGRPLPGTQAYLLDLHGEPVPVGVVGELYLGGNGLARGYRGRPGLTAGAFVPDPFSVEAQDSDAGGRRLYRTGDLARFLPDGRMMFLGRRDHQVKVRGFRIELGEVEAALLDHAEVREALVSARSTGDGEVRLVAFVALGPEGGEAPGEQEQEAWHRRLQGHLRRTLPDYMLPSVTVLLAALPRTPNGKVDRKALPDPELKAVAASAGAAARTPLEEVLCGIWAEVLGLPQVSVDANFFELGGHSLLATQVVSRLRTALGVDPSLKILFQAPTVAQLARRLEDAHRPALPEIPAANRDRPLPLSFSQERLWFFERLIHSSAVYNIPGALHLEGELPLPALVRALSRLIARHESLRTRFAEVQGRPVQAVVPASEAVLPWSRVDLQRLEGPNGKNPNAQSQDAESGDIQSTAEELIRREARRPFDLRRELGWRVVLVAVGPHSHRLLVTFHHILADGWSQGVFFRDLGELYDADLEHRRPQLPPLPVHFPDYALWQRRWLQGDALEEQLTFWRQRLEGAPAVLELPTDRPRPAVQTFHGAIARVALPEEAVEVLEGLARRSAASLFMVLLAGFDAVLHRITGARDLCVGVPIANRHRLEVENLVGFLVNTLVLRATPAPELPFAELLEQVRESTLEAYAHQDLPFEKLVEELRPERDLSHSPLFQVMFSLLDGRATELRLKGLEVTVEAP